MANKTSHGTQTVRIVANAATPKDKWTPQVKEETVRLLARLKLPDDDSRRRVRDEAISVLENCVPPVSRMGSQTGLIIGYVQSGKTMSFTTVAALARDNGYRMVIVIGGTSINLFGQSNKRLDKDLSLSERSDRTWQYFENPRATDGPNIQSALDTWNDLLVPESEKQIVLVTVMKQADHLRHLNLLLERMRLDGVPVLIVDDEADQAGLNSKVRKKTTSTIYRHLTRLRQLLPHHSLLQYTATPQAPLLINIIDALSPDFAEVLTPGEAYTGGVQFFQENPKLIKVIPSSEIPSDTNHLTDPPETFQLAMMIFYLGVAAEYLLPQDQRQANRSMLVHPSQKTDPHKQYFHWAERAKSEWLKILALDSSDPDRQDLIQELRRAYKDLAGTVPDLPSFDDLVTVLPRAISQTSIQEVNASGTGNKTPAVNWKNKFSHILVGGQAMDRGFTVEGLTVTYMPRVAGIGNADTIQQRARFFGYKRKYLGYCRVYLEMAVRDAFRAYITHEENIRKQMNGHKGKPLSEWKRTFFLAPALKPTRAAVLDLDYIRGGFSDSWYAPIAPHDSEDATESNRQVIRTFRDTIAINLAEDKYKRHLVAKDIPLKKTFEELLLNFKVTYPNDSQRLTGLMLQVKNHLDDNPNAVCDIYFMRKGEARKRTVKTTGRFQLFTGKQPKTGPVKYPGDREIVDKAKLAIQINSLNLDVQAESRIYKDVPALGIYVPDEMGRSWLSQEPSNAPKPTKTKTPRRKKA